MRLKLKLYFFIAVILFVIFFFFSASSPLRPGLGGIGAVRSYFPELMTVEPSSDGVRPESGLPPCVDKATGRANPLSSEYMEVARASSGTLNSGRFGNTRNGGKKSHKGIDLKAPVGTPIYAMCDGVVDRNVYVSNAKDGDYDAGGKYGNQVMINGSINGEQVGVFYAHLQPGGLLVKPGETVRKGQLIGYTGQTGNAGYSSVPNKHLHLEIRKDGVAVNPEPYLNGAVASDGSFSGIICD